MVATLALKLFLVPSLILAVTLAGRRWGPAVAGWLSAFPIVSGPILLAISLEQGAGFGATAAQATLLAVLAILVFSLAYAWAATRCAVAGSMAWAMAAYALSVLALQWVQPGPGVAFPLVVLSLLAAPRLFPSPAPVGQRHRAAWASGAPAQADAAPAPSPARASDLPWRMLAAAALVLAVTFSAAAIGARMSGFMAMFPVMSSVLVGFSHARSGAAFAIALLRGMVFGYFAFATFCLVLSLLLATRGITSAFLAALACALAVQLVARQLMLRPAMRGG